MALSKGFPEGEPRHPADDSELAEQVTRALEQWSNAPHPEEPSGPTAAELRAQLADDDLRLAILAEVDASAAERRLTRARELSGAFPDGAPRRPSEEDELTQQVANALAAWDARPDVSGTSVCDLRRQLNEIDKELAETSRGGLATLLRAIVRWFARLLGFAPRASGPEISDLAERRRVLEREIEDATGSRKLRAPSATQLAAPGCRTVRPMHSCGPCTSGSGRAPSRWARPTQGSKTGNNCSESLVSRGSMTSKPMPAVSRAKQGPAPQS